MIEFRFKEIHIGKLIETMVLEKNILPNRIYNFLDIDEVGLDKIYKEKDIKTDLLLRWCKLLEYDFFRIYSQHLLLYAPPANNNYVTVSNKRTKMPTFSKNLYTPEIIHFIVELVERKEKTPAEIIEKYRIPKTTLYKWIKKHKKEEN